MAGAASFAASEQSASIAVRHEEAAAFMASGYVKHTGKLGVCLATTQRT
jgi:thiamine pyrophosphate-dependent acetolactate synthase large subunit-like protein